MPVQFSQEQRQSVANSIPSLQQVGSPQVCMLPLLFRGRWAQKPQQQSRKPVAKLEAEVIVEVSRVEEEGEVWLLHRWSKRK